MVDSGKLNVSYDVQGYIYIMTRRFLSIGCV